MFSSCMKFQHEQINSEKRHQQQNMRHTTSSNGSSDIRVSGKFEQAITIKEFNEDAVASCIRELRVVIREKRKRHALVNEFLTESSTERLLQIRFLGAMNEFLQEPDYKERIAKGRKIESMFLHSGSMFQLVYIPKELNKKSTRSTLEKNLSSLREFVELELAQSAEIAQLVHLVAKS